MSLRYLLDTNILSAAIASTPHPSVLRRLDRHGGECGIATPVWHELLYGTRRLPPSKRRQAIEAFLDEVVRPSFPMLDYDERAATWHAERRAQLEAKGLTTPFVDGQIAAIAQTNGLILVTANTRDFEPFRPLDLEDWAHPSRPAT